MGETSTKGFPMKMISYHCLALGLAFATGTPVALAQLRVGVNAAGNAAAGLGATPGANPISAGVSGAAGANFDRPLPDRAGITTNDHATAGAWAEPNSVDAGSNESVGLSTSLNPSETLSQIRTTAFESRAAIFGEIAERMKAGAKVMDRLGDRATSLSGETRARFDAALDTAKAREKTLKRSLKAAHKATAGTWSKAQSSLSSDYDAYAKAMTELDASASAHD